VTNQPVVHVEHSPRPSPEQLSLPARAGSPQPLTGNGQIVNEESGFTILLDVGHFQPRNIKVSLSSEERVLSVEGERIDDDSTSGQTVKRCFSRKYAIPDDIKLKSIRALVAGDGVLKIKGSRMTWKETEIDVQFEPPRPQGAGLYDEKEDSAAPVTNPTSPTPTNKPLKLFTGESDEQSVSTVVGSEDGGKDAATERSVHFTTDEERHEPHYDPANDIRV